MKSNSTVEPTTLHDLGLYCSPHDAIPMSTKDSLQIAAACYLESSIELLELALCNKDLTPFVNRTMLERCVSRARDLHDRFVAKHISFDYVCQTLKQEFGAELK